MSHTGIWLRLFPSNRKTSKFDKFPICHAKESNLLLRTSNIYPKVKCYLDE